MKTIYLAFFNRPICVDDVQKRKEEETWIRKMRGHIRKWDLMYKACCILYKIEALELSIVYKCCF